MSFPNESNRWTVILNVTYHGWERKKKIQPRLSKTALVGSFFTCLSYWKISDLHLVQKKRIVLKNCVKNHSEIILTILCRIPHTHISASAKTLQIKILLLSAARLFSLRSVSHVKYSTFRKRRFRWCSL